MTPTLCVDAPTLPLYHGREVEVVSSGPFYALVRFVADDPLWKFLPRVQPFGHACLAVAGP